MTYSIHGFKRKSYRDELGTMSYEQDADAVETHVMNYADELAAGETISSAVLEVSGVSASYVVATPNVTLTVTGTGGTIQVVATTSAGRKLVRWLRFVPITRVQDYGD